MQTRKYVPIVAALVLVFTLLLGLSLVPQQPAAAAPAAAPTPVSVTRPGADGFITFAPFSTQVITADASSPCFDVGAYSVVDVLFNIDQTIVAAAANTVTLTTKWGIDSTTLASGVNLVASNAADAVDMQQAQVFGRYFCVLADVTNSNAVTITAQAIAK